MSRSTRIAMLTAIPVALFLLPIASFTINRATAADEIPRNVFVRDVSLGGLGVDEATTVLEDVQRELRSQRPVFIVNGTDFTLDPAAIGLEVQVADLIEEAMAQRRDGGFFGQFTAWLGSFQDRIDLELPVAIDEDALTMLLEQWEAQAVDRPAFQGAVVVVDGRATSEYPRNGLQIDKSVAEAIVFRRVAAGSGLPEELPIVDVTPQLTAADVDAAVEEANLMIGREVTLRSANPEYELVVSAATLAESLVAETLDDPARIELSFDAEVVDRLLDEHREAVEQPPLDARFVINDDDSVDIAPSRPGILLNAEQVTETLETLARSVSRRGELPLTEGVPPDFTTEEARAMGEIGLVSEFTTKHAAGEPRVTNIHRMADAVNNTIVWPGETFSLNEFIGPRTEAKGYVAAPMILDGELVDSVGGGVSQFATTFYNAVFFGCYEDVTHTPHSLYISRYPEGREATISWPNPDLKFRNDSDAVIIIKTWYTSTQIGVRFFGNNGGRHCDARKSDRYAFREAPVEYIADAEVPPTSEVVESSGAQGWSVTITRIMTMPDGSVIEETDAHAYRPQPRKIRVHPCNMPGSSATCPIEVPSVAGSSLADAQAALAAAGFGIAEGDPVSVENEASNGLVVSQSPGGGTWVDPGTVITVNLGVYVPPPPPDDPPPDDPPPDDPPPDEPPGDEPPPDDGDGEG